MKVLREPIKTTEKWRWKIYRNSPWWWSYEHFCLPVYAIARADDPTVIGSVALRKGPRKFCPHLSDCCRALMLTCWNSPLWQRCERCNNVLSSSWPPWSSRDMWVNWNETQASRAQLYEQPSALTDAWAWAGGCKQSLPRYPKGQSIACYQECGCHLNEGEKFFRASRGRISYHCLWQSPYHYKIVSYVPARYVHPFNIPRSVPAGRDVWAW